MDNNDRPLYITDDLHIFLESFSTMFSKVKKFVIAIAEPIDRDDYMHEYVLTPSSLYSAASCGLQSKEIIEMLRKFSKTTVNENIIRFIELHVGNYGRIQLIFEHNRYYVHSVHVDLLTRLLQDSKINECRLGEIDESKFEVQQNKIELLKKLCFQLGYPLLEEYDYAQDTYLPNLNIQLRPTTHLRPYQRESLTKMFTNNRAQSGLIVLACGAGKSMVGVSAVCKMQKSCVILCNSGVSIQQWKKEFETWSTINDSQIRLFTAEKKQKPTDACIFISTYQMMSFDGSINAQTIEIMELIKQQSWGLMILDEVHTMPAESFRKILSSVRAHVKLGLTATLVREDNKIDDLDFLIGPKLYEANWKELEQNGYIAQVHCAEVRCSMPQLFYAKYLSLDDNSQLRQHLCTMNPAKFNACQYLIDFHEKRQEKIIVSCDDIVALKFYALKLGKPLIYGDVSQAERMNVLENFRRNSKINTIFLSRVGDTSFDLPDATVLIQISSHGGSRRQEAQRLGRILRAKKNGSNQAFFYSLISENTFEMEYSLKRRSFLVNQGYTYKTIENLGSNEQDEQLSTEIFEKFI